VPDSITDSLGDSLTSRKPTGLYPLTLGKGFTKAEFDRIAIVPGDSIYIPAISGSIGVYGLVKYPGQIVCFEPQSISSLIRQAGGFSPDADRKSIEIVRKTTGLKTAVGQSDRAFDGDVVIVRQREEKGGFLTDLRDAAIIVGAIGITYLAIDNLTD
jgi:protein involved in polysaccharide export with SLBB domain